MNASSTKRILLAILNLLGIVGAGTILAGRVWTGVVQIAMALFSMALSIAPMVWLGLQLDLDRFDPALIQDQLNATPPLKLLAATGLAFVGVLLFFLNWAWSATTTGEIKRDSDVDNGCVP